MALNETDSDELRDGTSTDANVLQDLAPRTERERRLRSVVLRVAESYTRGQQVSIDELLAQHEDLLPELKDELRLQEITQQQYLASRQTLIPIGSATYSQSLSMSARAVYPPGEDHGVRVAGYEVLNEIKRGGQATVFQGIRLSTKRPVAIKVIYGGPLLTRRRKARLDREVDILARIDHHHIVGVLDFGKTVEGDLFIAMELIDGPELDGWVADRRRGRSSEDPELAAEILRLFVEVCDAAGEAHSLNIIHRDLKPSNVRVDRWDHPHLLDFGLARVLEEATEGAVTPPATQVSERTLTGQVIGSLYYLSPEQASGLNSQLDARSDVYSLGVMLYESLTGEPPYSRLGTLSEQLLRITDLVPRLPSAVIHGTGPIWHGVDAVVMKALEKDPSNRYANGRELAQALRQALAGEWTGPTADAPTPAEAPPAEPVIAEAPPPSVEPVIAAVEAPPTPVRPRSRRKPLMVAAAAVAAAAVTGFYCLHDSGSPSSKEITTNADLPNRLPAPATLSPIAIAPATLPATTKPVTADSFAPRLVTVVLRRANFVRDGEYFKKTLGSTNDPKAAEHRLQLQVKTGIGGTTRDSYIELDLSSVPSGARVNSAKLRVHGFMMPLDLKAGGQMKVSAFKLANPADRWDPHQITWEYRPFMLGYQSADTSLGSVDILSGAKRWSEIDLTTFVQDELKAGRKHPTVVLHVAQPTSEAVMILDSSLTPTAPELKLEYLPPGAP